MSERDPANPSLRLHIEEVVLHGVSPGDGRRFGEALEGELLRLFREEGVPPALARGGAVERLDAGPLAISPNARPEVGGAALARAIYGSLGGGRGGAT
jgi:hypothetical protein